MFNKICQIASLLSLLLSGSMAAFGFVAIRYRTGLGRKVTYITDTVLETLYLFLNLSFYDLELKKELFI